jgi:hypothetical protein
LISADIGNQEIERIDRVVRAKTFRIRSLQAEVEALVAKTEDVSLRKALTELSEAIRYSDPMSHAQLADLENKIEAKTAALIKVAEHGNAENAGTLCAELRQLVAERNRKCNILK